MGLMQYQWEIYLKAGGQKVVDHFQRVIDGDRDGFEELVVECLFAFCPDKALIEQCAKDIETVVSFENENGAVQPQYQFLDDQGNPIPDQDVPFLFLDDTKAAYLEGCEKTPKEMDMYFDLYGDISIDSTDWAFSAPNHCIPYYYSGCYNVLCSIAGIFGIELPAIPGKVQYNDRYDFYGELCNVFHTFRLKNGWSAAELWAFLYDYGPKSAGGMTWIWNELPSPRKAYVFGLPADVEQEENAKHKSSASRVITKCNQVISACCIVGALQAVSVLFGALLHLVSMIRCLRIIAVCIMDVPLKFPRLHTKC